jgi:uroporphyrinogen-III synthase
MGGAGGVPAAVIGPVTAAAARQAGLDVRVVASPATIEGLLAALALHFARGGTP